MDDQLTGARLCTACLRRAVRVGRGIRRAGAVVAAVHRAVGDAPGVPWLGLPQAVSGRRWGCRAGPAVLRRGGVGRARRWSGGSAQGAWVYTGSLGVHLERRCTRSLGVHREHGCAPGVPWLHLPQAVPTRGGRCRVEPPVLRGRVRAGPWSQRCPSRESRQRVRREAMRAMTPRAAMSVPQAWAVWCQRGSSSRPMVRPRRSMVEAPAA